MIPGLAEATGSLNEARSKGGVALPGADGAPLEFAKIERVVIRGKTDTENSDA